MCKLNTNNSKKENEMNECHAKVIGQLKSQRSKKDMMTSTHHANQVNKLTSHLISTKSKYVKQKELFHSARVARRQVVKDAAAQIEKLDSYIKYLNGWLMVMA